MCDQSLLSVCWEWYRFMVWYGGVICAVVVLYLFGDGMLWFVEMV